MKNIIPNRVAMIVFAIPFLYIGINHLIYASSMASMSPIPPGKFWIMLTGIAQILAGIAFIINVKSKLAGYLLALYLLLVVLLVRLPMGFHDANQNLMLVKDLGLLAGSILLANQGK
ncbi:DoxX family membrane protein [Thermoflavifilum thermophilum]|uniref:DoxX protein n=1 Tax=Thermoflavifilum thermophilum TaxID=1393122 RepID=A0A1I7NCY1_9BACT|nr:DoxX family membrane protein [Thermoflavifilum thermophilum]SFV32491.1 DoxX protein [Thermoflavifilum thermophilum]